MDCPKCEGKTSVVNGGRYIGLYLRERKCKECGHKFWTEEELSDDPQLVRSFLASKQYEYRERKKQKC